MLDLSTTLKLRYGLASLTNAELYYVISNLFRCGDFGEHLIEKERLYVNVDSEDYINFFFVCTVPVLDESQTEPETYLYIGRFDEEFEEIEIYRSPGIPYRIYRAQSAYYESFTVNDFIKKGARLMVRPVSLIDGLLKLALNPDIKDREMNPLFSIGQDDKIRDGFRTKFEFYAGYNEDKGEYNNFTGIYYLIAEPIDDWEKTGTYIYDYDLIEGQYEDDPSDVVLSKKLLTQQHGKNFEKGIFKY